MAKYRLHAGADIELLTKKELNDALRDNITDAFGIWRSFAYGLKSANFPVMRAAIASGSVTIGSTGVANSGYAGPREGFAWRVTRVSIYGLNSGDIVQVFRGDPRDAAFIAALTAPGDAATDMGVALMTSHGVLLRPGDHITVTGSGLSATGMITVTGEAIEAPAEMAYKLIGG